MILSNERGGENSNTMSMKEYLPSFSVDASKLKVKLINSV